MNKLLFRMEEELIDSYLAGMALHYLRINIAPLILGYKVGSKKVMA